MTEFLIKIYLFPARHPTLFHPLHTYLRIENYCKKQSAAKSSAQAKNVHGNERIHEHGGVPRGNRGVDNRWSCVASFVLLCVLSDVDKIIMMTRLCYYP